MAEANTKHHTIPAGYMRLFSRPGRKGKRRVEVFDVKMDEWRTQLPENVCVEKGFYSVDVEGVDKNVVERDFVGKFESDAIPVIREFHQAASAIRDRRSVPQPTPLEWTYLLQFVALMHVRNSPQREKGTAAGHLLGEATLNEALSSKKDFEDSVARARADGVDLGEDFDFDKLKRLVDGDQIKMELTPTFQISMMVDGWREFAGALEQKYPSLLIGGGELGLLVTSDNPVGFYGIDHRSSSKFPYVMDPRNSATGVVMPLSSEIAIRFDPVREPEVRSMTRREVAMVNSMSALPDSDLIIARTRSFRWLDRNEVEHGADDFGSAARSLREQSRKIYEERMRKGVPRLFEKP